MTSDSIHTAIKTRQNGFIVYLLPHFADCMWVGEQSLLGIHYISRVVFAQVFFCLSGQNCNCVSSVNAKSQ